MRCVGSSSWSPATARCSSQRMVLVKGYWSGYKGRVSEQRVHLVGDVDDYKTVCDAYTDQFMVEGGLPWFAEWREFCSLPLQAQCLKCRAKIGRPPGPPDQVGVFCASHDQTMAVALFCGGLAGSFDARLRDLLSEALEGGNPIALLDEAEQRGLDRGGWPLPAVDWPRVARVPLREFPDRNPFTSGPPVPRGHGARQAREWRREYLGEWVEPEGQHVFRAPRR